MEWKPDDTILSNVLTLLGKLTTPNTELQKKIYAVRALVNL